MTANGFPYFQFHIDKWQAGKISAFDLEEQGFYLYLCVLAWVSHGSFSVCSTTVQRRYRKTAEWVTSTVAAFVEVGIIYTDGDNYRIKFIDDQIELLSGKRQQRVDAGKASAAKRAAALLSSESTVESTVEKSREEKSSTLNSRSTVVRRSFDLLFESCWELFGKYGVKKKALEYWRKIPADDRQAIADAIPDYMDVVANGRKQMQFEGWINPLNRKWDVDWKRAAEVESKSGTDNRKSWTSGLGTGGL